MLNIGDLVDVEHGTGEIVQIECLEGMYEERYGVKIVQINPQHIRMVQSIRNQVLYYYAKDIKKL